MAGDSADVLQEQRRPSLLDEIGAAETDALLENFGLLKQRAASGRDGEMRVAVKRDPDTGVIEITYIGVSDKADLSKLRRMYTRLKQGGTRF